MIGDDPDKDRTAVTKRFTDEDDIILVSTDAAAEGLNLQTRCHHLIHLELPFNPNRLGREMGGSTGTDRREIPSFATYT